MPTYKKPYKKYRKYKKRTYKKKNPSGKRVNAVSASSGQLPLPNRILTRHRYCETRTLDGASGAAASYTYAVNGLYEPIAAGHQPMGFDQFAALYQNYKVVGAKITATFTNNSNTTDTGNQYVGVQFHENSSFSPSYITQIAERGRCVYRLLGLANSGHDTRSITMKWSGKKWYGSNNFKGGDTAGTISSNPAQLFYASIFSAADYDGQNPGSCDVMITIDYIVEWFTPLQMNQS